MGSIALVGAVGFAFAAVLAGIVQFAVGERFGVRPLRAQMLLQRLSLALVGVAVLHVVWLLASEDTTHVISVESTRPGLGVVRRIMGLWGGSAGSLLFFTLVIGGTLVIAPLTKNARVIASIVLAGLTVTTTFGAPPFERLDAPAIAGSGLSPILEHWAMIIHPPLLYIGLGLSLLPALVEPRFQRRMALVAVAILTAALALGGAWAYVELGWGGWYAWDPVENIALIPWLLLMTGAHVQPSHPIARWTTILVWPTVLAGAAMTRTSQRTSVHTFANADELARYLWPLTIVATLLVIIHQIDRHAPAEHPPPTRRLWPLVLIGYSAFVVALGTFRPFVPGDGTDGSFYTRFLFPAAVIGAAAMGIAPRRASVGRISIESIIGAAIGLAITAGTGTTNWWQLVLAAAIGVGVVTTLAGAHRSTPRTLAHLGMILVLAGALGGTASSSLTFQLNEGDSREFEGYEIRNDGIEFVDGPAPVIIATFTVGDDQLQPSITVFPERGLRLPEVATRRWLHEDLQLILRDADDDGGVVVTANVEPLTQAVWLGVLLLVIGVLLQAYSPRFLRRSRKSSLTVDAAESSEVEVGVASGGGGGGDPVAGGAADPALDRFF